MLTRPITGRPSRRQPVPASPMPSPAHRWDANPTPPTTWSLSHHHRGIRAAAVKHCRHTSWSTNMLSKDDCTGWRSSDGWTEGSNYPQYSALYNLYCFFLFYYFCLVLQARRPAETCQWGSFSPLLSISQVIKSLDIVHVISKDFYNNFFWC